MEEGKALDSFGLTPYRFEPTGHGLELSTDDDSDEGDEPPVLPAVRLGNCLQPLVLRVALVGMMRIRGDAIAFPIPNR